MQECGRGLSRVSGSATWWRCWERRPRRARSSCSASTSTRRRSRWGSRPAVLSSLFGVVCFNFFYLPPVGRLTIDDPDNWVALFAFLVTAVTAGQLSARAKRRAEEADAGRREIERLYAELQDAFERASQAKALQQSERLKSALLDAVTHDLRTPLTSIKASVTTLLEDFRSGAEVK